ncbi:hypothetical protein WDW86_17895, partial [Bdellovibrionota bacterium FG-2]
MNSLKDKSIPVMAILVEEELRIRKLWQHFFHKNGLLLLVFDSPEQFLKHYKPNGRPIELFFDQDFGNRRGEGVKLARLVVSWPGRVATNLVTSYEPQNFASEFREGILDDVLSKFPEEIFGPNYFLDHCLDAEPPASLFGF